jgi:predicted ATPase
LFGVDADAPDASVRRPLPLEAWRLDRPTLQAALTKFFLRVGLEAKLLIAADDVERIDDASLALLAALAQGARETQLLIVASVDDRIAAGALPALDMLRDRATHVSLSLLSRADVELMFASVFGNVPNLTLVSDRIHAIAKGSPRQSMQLAQHLLETKRVRFSDGQWVLPHELALRDLPANAEEALRVRLDALRPLARRLIESQAVALSDLVLLGAHAVPRLVPKTSCEKR